MSNLQFLSGKAWSAFYYRIKDGLIKTSVKDIIIRKKNKIKDKRPWENLKVFCLINNNYYSSSPSAISSFFAGSLLINSRDSLIVSDKFS